MNTYSLKTVVIGSIVNLAAVTVSGADTRWNRVTPQGAGFSIEAPAAAKPSDDPGEYNYSSGFSFLAVKILPVDPSTRQLVERGERKRLLRCLESLRDSMIDGMEGSTRRDSSSGEVDGHLSLRFAMENTDFKGSNLLVLTADRLFLVITVGPKGSPDADAKRFLRSFRVVKTDTAPAAASHDVNAASKNPVAAKLSGPMLSVARLVIEEKMNPLIDHVVQNAPPAARLGNRWGPSNTAWQQARAPISSRIARVVDAYEKSGDVTRTLESELERLAPESQSALAMALNGPAGSAIVRQLALSQFIAVTMAENPDGPGPADPGWKEKLRTLQTTFDQRLGTSLAGDDGGHRAEVDKFFSAQSSDLWNMFFTVVSKATRELESGINLTVFDNSDAIQREIETVIARVK